MAALVAQAHRDEETRHGALECPGPCVEMTGPAPVAVSHANATASSASNGTVGATDSAASVGERLAAFAAGCLGVPTPAKAGSKLGIMGSVSEEEALQVLHHLEQLARQRVERLVPGQMATGGPDLEEELQTHALHREKFEAALCEACGTVTVADIFARLPRDVTGRADLLQIFGMSSSSGDQGREDELLSGFTADYQENPAELAAVAPECCGHAATLLLEGAESPSSSSWEKDARALNMLRAEVAQRRNGARSTAGKSSALLLTAIARHCTSRRPALAKSALRAFIELADTDIPAEEGAWLEGASAAITACLDALKVTKAAAKVAEEALSAVSARLCLEAGLSASVDAVANCVHMAAQAKPAQPLSVNVGLRALSNLGRGAETVEACSNVILTLTKEVLGCRSLSLAFAEARALQRLVQPPQVEQGPLSKCGAGSE